MDQALTLCESASAIDTLPLSAADLALLHQWAASGEQPPVEQTVLSAFARQARNRPDHLAVVAGARQFTYRELAELAAQVALRLAARGVHRGDLVGVSCQRSPELIAVVLGLWQCGAVYVPLDPKYPSERLTTIVRDAAPRIIVHDNSLPTDAWSAERRVSLSTLFTADAPVAHHCAVELNGAALDEPAVVLYTSGSTGIPKGVVLTQRNLANHHAWEIRAFDLTPADRRTSFSSINFDAAIEELFCTLTAGATLVLPAADTLDSFGRLIDFIDREQLTAFFMTTSLWRELTHYLGESDQQWPTSLRLLAVGGERATRQVYQQFLQVGGDRLRWVNVYGPTETTIYASTYEHAPGGDHDDGQAPPIGRPVDNTLLYVLDTAGKLVKPGEPGELYIGGVGVGVGYLNNEARTRQRFVDQPASELPPGRYYRTGDQVRFRDDGQLEYLGRLDDQIKLRGFRIEPGEIDAALQQHPDVRHAVVVPQVMPSGTQVLTAFVVLRSDAIWNEPSLRQFVGERLPSYMVPQTFQRLTELPMSPNGKVDRRALKQIVPTSTAPDEEPTASPIATEMEQVILDIWKSALHVERLQLDDDFFAVGGDSLKAMEIVSKLEKSCQRTLPVTSFLRARTVRHLAEHLQTPHDKSELTPIVLLRDGQQERPLFFVHALAGDVWIYTELVAQLQTSCAMYGLQLQGLEQEAPPHDTVEACAAAYVDQLRAVQPKGPYHLIGYSSGGWIAYEMMQQLHAAGEQVEFLGLLDAGIPMALEQQFAPSRWQRAWRTLAKLPDYWHELQGLSRHDRWQRLRIWSTQLGERVQVNVLRLFSNWRKTTTDGEMATPADYEVWQWFEDDISFFSQQRRDLIKQHYGTFLNYLPRSCAGAIHLFRVRRQPVASIPTAALGWEDLLRGPIDVHFVPGSHGTMMKAPHVCKLAQAIDLALVPFQSNSSIACNLVFDEFAACTG